MCVCVCVCDDVKQVPVQPVYQPVDVTIELPVPPEFVEPLRDIAAQEGTRVTFDGCVRGRPEPTIRWYAHTLRRQLYRIWRNKE